MSNRKSFPKRRAAPTKIIDNCAIPDDDEEDELPHENEEELLALMNKDDSSSEESSCEESSYTESEEKIVVPVKTKKQSDSNLKKRGFICSPRDIIPHEGSYKLKGFEEQFCETTGPISAARIFTEKLISFIVQKNYSNNNLSYFMIICEGLTAKKYSYLVVINGEKYSVKVCPMKDIPKPLSVESDKTEKPVTEIKRVNIPEPKKSIDKKIVPRLSDGSIKIINSDQTLSHDPVKKKTATKK